jgi:hypothetical protein
LPRLGGHERLAVAQPRAPRLFGRVVERHDALFVPFAKDAHRAAVPVHISEVHCTFATGVRLGRRCGETR